MNNTVLFVISSNFQLLFSYIIKSYIVNADSKFFILDSKNKEVNQMAEQIIPKNHFRSFVSLEKSVQGMLKSNKVILKNIENAVNEISPSLVIVFKDNDLINCKVIEAASKRSSKIVLIQEGINLYSPRQVSVSKKIQQSIIRLLGYPKLYGITQGLHPKVDIICGTDLKNIPKNKIKNKQLIEIPSTLPPKYILDEFSKAVNPLYIEELRKTPAKSILYLGQPLSELGYITHDDEAVFLEKMIMYINQKGYNLIIKPHPFEKIAKYQCFDQDIILLNGAIPAEIIPMHTSLICVLTPYSSAADNMSVWYKIPVFYLHDLILDYEFDFTNEMHGHFVKSYHEFESIVNQLQSEKNQNFNDSKVEFLYQEFVNNIM